jgi:hypothetical protein
MDYRRTRSSKPNAQKIYDMPEDEYIALLPDPQKFAQRL